MKCSLQLSLAVRKEKEGSKKKQYSNVRADIALFAFISTVCAVASITCVLAIVCTGATLFLLFL
jgi:hypothetical protein